MATLGTKLVRLRKAKGYSQEEAADLTGVSQPAYNKWESGINRPNEEHIIKICEVFDVEREELLDDEVSVFTNNTVTNSTIFNPTNSVMGDVYMVSPELLQTLLDNQKEMAKLINNQGQLINELIGKGR